MTFARVRIWPSPYYRCSWLVFAAMSSSATAWAQTTTVTPTLQEVVVTAEKRPEREITVPISMQTLSGDLLNSRAITSLSDLTGYVAGLAISNSGSPGQNGIVLQGLATGYNNSFNAPLVASYIDGVPVGASGGGTAGARGGFFSLDLMPYDIERIDVLRGPQGTLYGADAMGGLLEYTLIKPSLEKFQAQTGGGLEHVKGSGEPSWTYRGTLSAPLVTDRLAFRLSGYYQHDAGYIDNIGIGVKDSNKAKEYGGRATLLWKPLDTLSVEATALTQFIHSYDDSAVLYDEAAGRPVYGDLIQSTHFTQPFTQRTELYYVNVDWDLGFAQLTSSSSYSTLTSALQEDLSSFPYVPGYPNALVPFIFSDSVKKYTQEVRLASPNTGRLQWLGGLFYTSEHPEEFDQLLGWSAPYVPLPPPSNALLYGIDPGSTNVYTERALFGDLTYKFTRRFDLTGGVRYSQNRSAGCDPGIFGIYGNGGKAECTGRPWQHVWTWMANARYHLDRDSIVYGRVATGYRPGGGCSTCGIAALDVPGIYYPDRLIDYEMGYKGEYFERLNVQFSVFDINWRDIQLTVVNSSGYGYPGNGGSAVSRGADLTLAYTTAIGLRLGLSSAFTDAHITEDAPGVGGRTGDPLPVSSRWTGSLTLDYSKPLADGFALILGGDYRYRNKIYNQFKSSEFPLPMGPQNVVDLYAGAELTHVTIRLYAKNAFDNRSYTGVVYTSNPELAPFVPVQPQTMGVSVDYSY